jgi:DNA replicative helicase MCM subunit Mcm2 (Cdc46/Mcm family)
MKKHEHECDNCGMYYVLSYDEDEAVEEAKHCPFCGETNDDIQDDEDGPDCDNLEEWE